MWKNNVNNKIYIGQTVNKEDVLDIRKKHAEGITVSNLHRSYYPSVSRETIKRVVEYKTFKNL